MSKLDEELTLALKEYVRYPEVSIMVKEIQGSRTVVLGQIERPGVYNIRGGESLLEVVAQKSCRL